MNEIETLLEGLILSDRNHSILYLWKILINLLKSYKKGATQNLETKEYLNSLIDFLYERNKSIQIFLII